MQIIVDYYTYKNDKHSTELTYYTKLSQPFNLTLKVRKVKGERGEVTIPDFQSQSSMTKSR